MVETHGPVSRRTRFFLAYSPFVTRMLRRFGFTGADADDAHQRVFMIVLGKMERVTPGYERPFLYTLVRREAARARRTALRQAEVQHDQALVAGSVSTRPDELSRKKQALLHIEAALTSLPGELRDVWTLAEVDGLSAQAIAERCAIPVGTVKSRLRRARTGIVSSHDFRDP